MRKPFSVILLICALMSLSACASRTKTADYALSSEYVSLDRGSTYKLSIEYDTLHSYDFDVEWVSDDPDIAEVVDGTLYGIDAGVTSVWAELTVHTEDGDTARRLRCTVTVKDNRVEPQSIYFDSPSLTVLQYTQAARSCAPSLRGRICRAWYGAVPTSRWSASPRTAALPLWVSAALP